MYKGLGLLGLVPFLLELSRDRGSGIVAGRGVGVGIGAGARAPVGARACIGTGACAIHHRLPRAPSFPEAGASPGAASRAPTGVPQVFLKPF